VIAFFALVMLIRSVRKGQSRTNTCWSLPSAKATWIRVPAGKVGLGSVNPNLSSRLVVTAKDGKNLIGSLIIICVVLRLSTEDVKKNLEGRGIFSARLRESPAEFAGLGRFKVSSGGFGLFAASSVHGVFDFFG